MKRLPVSIERAMALTQGEIEALGVDELSHAIRAMHEYSWQLAVKTVEGARHTGVLLRAAKAKVPHGQWAQWVKENCGFSLRSAQGYMQLVDVDPSQEAQRLGIRRVLDLHAEHREAPSRTVTVQMSPSRPLVTKSAVPIYVRQEEHSSSLAPQ